MKQNNVSTSLPQKAIIAIATCTLLLTTIFLLNKNQNLTHSAQAASEQHVEDYVSDLSQPVAFDWLPDNSLIIIQKSGQVLRFTNGQIQTIATIPVSTLSERGLLGIAVDPKFSNNRAIYLFYTTPDAVNRAARYTLTSDYKLTDEKILLDNIFSSSQGNHNAGDLHFDASRNLYISTGDGGGGNNCGSCSQKLDSPNGKILRINPDTGEGVADNPFFANSNETTKKVWALGFRNPYRFTINPNTNQLYIADVGENRYEELDLGKPGLNYGWPRVEGPEPSNQTGITYPIFWYGRSGNTDSSFNSCSSITGGAFAKGINLPADIATNYFFGDYTCGKIWTINPSNPSTPSLFLQNAGAVVHLSFGSDGALYYSDIAAGKIKRVTYTSSPTTTPIQSPTPTITPITNTKPQIQIIQPQDKGTALPGTIITAKATASDKEDGTLSSENISWNIIRHHGTTHTHPWAQGTGESIEFPMPQPEDLETTQNSFIEIIATAKDSQGATTQQSISLHFQTVLLNFQTQPAGLKLRLNNIEYTAPINFSAVPGQQFPVSASDQTLQNSRYSFTSWSDNQLQQHTFTTPETNTTLRATFTLQEATPSSTPHTTSSPSPSPTTAPTTNPTPIPTPSISPIPSPTLAPTITPTTSPTLQPTLTPTPTITPTFSPSPQAKPTTRLILCSYDDSNGDGIHDQGENIRSSSFTYNYNNVTQKVASNWWSFWTQGCAKVTVPSDTKITVDEKNTDGYIPTALFADGAKTDREPYTYTSEVDEIKVLWYLDQQQTKPTPSATISPSQSSPTPTPSTSPSRIPSPLPLNTFKITQAEVTPPFVISSDTLYQPTRTVESIETSGRASIMFIITSEGNYRLKAYAYAADHTTNSIYYNIDQEPGIMNIWDFPPATQFQEVISSMRSNNQKYIEQIKENSFPLKEGTHQLIIRGREPNLQLKTISIEKVGN